jgi:hypothetical protein
MPFRFRRFWSHRSGNFAVAAALAVVPLATAVGLAVDYSEALRHRAVLQQALDAAVLAGARETDSDTKVKVAQQQFEARAANDWETASNAAFKVDASGLLVGTAQAQHSLNFGGMFGMGAISLGVRSAAVSAGSSSKVCILLVNPTKSQSLLVNSGANLNAPNCEIHVRSTANPAAIFNSGTALQVKRICIKGTNIIKNGGANPPAETNCAAIADPFAGKLPTLSVGACDYNNQVYNPGNVTLQPGVYCGWTNFNGSGNLTFKPGLYIIKSGGMTFNSGWTVTGTGVTFYLTDQNATLTFNGNVNTKLSPPASGTYANILMFEPTGLPYTNLPINGTSGSTLQGLLYLPSRDVTINSISNVNTDKVTMVFSSLIFNALNWTFDAGDLAMSSSSGGTAKVRLAQ